MLASGARAAVAVARGASGRLRCTPLGNAFIRCASDTSDRDPRYAALPSRVEEAARAIDKAFTGAGVGFAIMGAVALSAHGKGRATEDVDVLVNSDELKAATDAISGRGWMPRYRGSSRKFRDTIRSVDIDLLSSGEFPGDGRPKPVSFPRIAVKDEQLAAENTIKPVEIGGLHVVPLAKIVELKVASGMTMVTRVKDLADVQDLIKVNNLPREFAEGLNFSVRDKYVELWDAVHGRSAPAGRPTPAPGTDA